MRAEVDRAGGRPHCGETRESPVAALDFVHLHVHSSYSLLEGALTIARLAELAKADKQAALALTDTDNMFGVLEFSEKMAGAGIQPIVGCALAIDFGDTDHGARNANAPIARERIVLLAAREAGYRSLMRLSSRAFLDTPSNEPPRLKLDWFEGETDGIIALTGGPGGPLDRAIAAGQSHLATTRLDALRALFGDRLYVELQRHGTPQERISEPVLIDLAYAQGQPLVATNEPFFATAADYGAHDALICIAEARLIAETDRRQIPPDHRFKSHAGMGVTARVGGRPIVIGNRRLMQEHGVGIEDGEPHAARLESRGRTVMWVAALDPQPRWSGLIGVSDPIKPEAAAAVRHLTAIGIETVLLTGDNERTAAAVAAQLGIRRVLAGVLPEEKAAEVRRLQAEGRRVGMVGDGVNDAPALAAADVGFAMGTGTDIAMQTAGVTLMRGDPRLLGDAIAVSRATYRKIRQGLFWAFIYNVIGLPAAAFGFLSPVIAGAAMALSSVSVVSNALLLRRWRTAADRRM